MVNGKKKIAGSGMNNALFQYKLGEINGASLQRISRQLEFAKILECNAPRCYRHSRRSKIATGVTSLNIDTSTGNFLLSSGNDGSVALWALDEKFDRLGNELFNKRIDYCARNQEENDLSSGIPPARKKAKRSSEPPNVVHTFQTKQNKFRMYRQSSSLTSDSTQSEETAPSEGHRFAITSVKWYSIDNGMFFTGSNDCKVKLWDTQTFRSVQEVDIGYRINQLDTDTDGTYIIVASEDYYPRLIDLRTIVSSGITNLSHKKMEHEILCCKSNPQKPHVVCTGDAQGNVKLWDLRMRNRLLLELGLEPSGRAHLKSCNELCWNENGTQLASTGNDGKCYIWSPFSLGIPAPRQIGPPDIVRNKYKKRTSQRLLWYDKYIIFNTDYGDIQIFETHKGKLWNRIDLPTSFSNVTNTSKKLTSFFTGMAMQTNMANSKGIRLYLGTNAPNADPGNGCIYEYLHN